MSSSVPAWCVQAAMGQCTPTPTPNPGKPALWPTPLGPSGQYQKPRGPPALTSAPCTTRASPRAPEQHPGAPEQSQKHVLLGQRRCRCNIPINLVHTNMTDIVHISSDSSAILAMVRYMYAGYRRRSALSIHGVQCNRLCWSVTFCRSVFNSEHAEDGWGPSLFLCLQSVLLQIHCASTAQQQCMVPFVATFWLQAYRALPGM